MGNGISVGVLTALAKQVLERTVGLEVAQQLGLAGRGDDDGVVDLFGSKRLLNDILDDGLVEHRQHLFGRALGARQKTRAKTGGGDDCLHIIQGSFRRRKCALCVQRKRRRPNCDSSYVNAGSRHRRRQMRFFSRSTQIIAGMMGLLQPSGHQLACKTNKESCRFAAFQSKIKDGVRNANPVCKEIWRESLIT